MNLQLHYSGMIRVDGRKPGNHLQSQKRLGYRGLHFACYCLHHFVCMDHHAKREREGEREKRKEEEKKREEKRASKYI